MRRHFFFLLFCCSLTLLSLQISVLFSHVEAITVKNVMHLFIDLIGILSICIITLKQLCMRGSVGYFAQYDRLAQDKT